jgi:hypothetical protein
MDKRAAQKPRDAIDRAASPSNSSGGPQHAGRHRYDLDLGGVMKRKLIDLVATACLVASLAVPAAAQDGSQVIVDGNLWLQSPPDVRKAFIVGAENMMALESAYAKKKGTPLTLSGTKTSAALEHMTLDQISDRITRWYAANPDRRATPVIGVIWTDIVEPGAPK